MTGPIPIAIAGEEALADFRRGLTASRILDLLRQAAGRLLIQLAVGVGKTTLLVQIIIQVLTGGQGYDLIVVLFPRWDILDEVLARLPGALDPVVLRPRPAQDCGELNNEWKRFERTGCGVLGREKLCGACARRQECFWPDQYGKRLQGTQLIFTTQQHLTLNSNFIFQLKTITRAEKSLVLIDESDLLLRSARRTVENQDLRQFIAVLERAADVANESEYTDQWLGHARLLAMAPTKDLQRGWWSFPRVSPDWAGDIQRTGWENFGDRFRFLGFELGQFAQSDRGSRERLPNGDLQYAVKPYLGDAFIIFSGSIAMELVRYRIDPDHRQSPVRSPFADHTFMHPGTRWYNVRSVAGAARNFGRNASVTLDFFAAKVARNIRQDKRTLLIARKKFCRACKQGLQERIRRLGVDQACVVTGNWDHIDLENPKNVPLINFGVAGINRFEDFEAAYCLTGYYVSPRTLATAVHDYDTTADQFPVSIRTTGAPPRRKAHVELPDDRATILPKIAQGVLDELEANTIVQAVGRVRPFTRPREVITFHAGELPGVSFDLDFRSLAAARNHFNIPTQRSMRCESRVLQARLLREEGLTQDQIAQEIGVSTRTVRRYLQ